MGRGWVFRASQPVLSMTLFLTRTAQHARAARPQPTWVRVTASFCMLLTFWLGIAQAVHRHGDWSTRSSQKLQISAQGGHDSGELSCPLCAILHSVRPGSLQDCWFSTISLPAEVVLNALRVEKFWHFELFGRPPPGYLLNDQA